MATTRFLLIGKQDRTQRAQGGHTTQDSPIEGSKAVQVLVIFISIHRKTNYKHTRLSWRGSFSCDQMESPRKQTAAASATVAIIE